MKKIISMLLVLVLMLTVLAVGVTTTSAAETATVTIYGIDGSTEVKEISVGEEFKVYTTLDVTSSVPDGLIGSIQGTQTYTASTLALVDEVDSAYGEFVDVNTVFPIIRSAVMANGAVAGKISYNASAPTAAKAFKFDSSFAKVIVTTYKVTAAGTAEVKNAISDLAAADDDMTRIIHMGTVQTGKTVAGSAYFDDPVPEIDHAEVTIYSLDGTSETREFAIGDTFTVYTKLDATASADSKISSVLGAQKYTTKVLTLESTDYPVTGDRTVENTETNGIIKYAASTPSMSSPFIFGEDSQLIASTYTVKGNGYAEITNSLTTLAAADDDLTKIVFGGETQPGMTYDVKSSFSAEAPTTATVTIVGLDGRTEVKEFNVGDTFTVYTVLNAGTTVASLDGAQTYTTRNLELTDAVTGEYNEIADPAAMFPVVGANMTAGVKNGTIKFNATTGGAGYAFNNDKAKLIVTNYKVTKAGTARIATTLKTVIADDNDLTKIVYDGEVQEGKTVAVVPSFTDPGSVPIPTEPETIPETVPETQPETVPETVPETQPETQPETTPEPDKTATITIYGIDGTTEQQTYRVGDSFTVYTTLNASKLKNSMISNISAVQTYSANLQNVNSVDSDGIITDETMFPILGSAVIGRIYNNEIKYNASKPHINNGFVFANDDALLIVSKYVVTAEGAGEVRNSITTMSLADINLTRVIDKGVVKDGYTVGGIATFTQPGNVRRFKLGDTDGNDDIETKDATLVQRINADMEVNIPEEIYMNGDVDGNGELDIYDATFIQRFLADMDSNYPVGEYVTR